MNQPVPPPRQTKLLAADVSGIGEAAELLRAGGLVAMPTETVYGLAADATSGAAVAGIYAAKERPSFNPLISHLPDLASARRQGLFDANALALAQAFWPGPLTLVVPASPGCTVSDLARAGLPSVALRVPAHPVAHAVLEAAGLGRGDLGDPIGVGVVSIGEGPPTVMGTVDSEGTASSAVAAFEALGLRDHATIWVQPDASHGWGVAGVSPIAETLAPESWVELVRQARDRGPVRPD